MSCHLPFFKVLIVFICNPVTAPLKPVFPENPVHPVISVNHVILILSFTLFHISLCIDLSVFRCDGIPLYKGVDSRINVNRPAISVF